MVLYKIDRLTRSPADFVRLVEWFERRGASFAPSAQAFNTTTSMGRLTLNMLLSFAQFEREVTGERIRDKIAASKARGMWMGGMPPLGYEPAGRTLKIVEVEAHTVRHIFERYLQLRRRSAARAEGSPLMAPSAPLTGLIRDDYRQRHVACRRQHPWRRLTLSSR